MSLDRGTGITRERHGRGDELCDSIGRIARFGTIMAHQDFLK